MGVSAVFVSALALTRLPTPEHPPANQAQYLAATIQPIVSFVVLGSIIIRKHCHEWYDPIADLVMRWSEYPILQHGPRRTLSYDFADHNVDQPHSHYSSGLGYVDPQAARCYSDASRRRC